MSEISIPYSLVTPSGTLTFNATDNSDGYYLSDVGGMDGGALRSSVENLPQRDGAYVFDSLRGARYPVLSGEIRMSTSGSLITRATLMDTLLSYTDSIRKADGTLKWTPNNQPERSCTVRLLDTVAIGGVGILKQFVIPLVAGDPTAYDTTGGTGTISSMTSGSGSFGFPFSFRFTFGLWLGGTVTITPGGNIPTFPTVTITGPITGPQIENTTTGLKMSLPRLNLAATDTLTINMAKQTVLLGTASKIGTVDVSNSDFWSLTNGAANLIRLSGSGATDTGTASIAYANAWV